MRYKVISVRDRAIDTFGTPVCVAAIGAAVRSFGDQINDSNSPFSNHPEDFDLYSLGEFDDQTGQFTNEGPVQVAVGKDYAKA